MTSFAFPANSSSGKSSLRANLSQKPSWIASFLVVTHSLSAVSGNSVKPLNVKKQMSNRECQS